MAGKKHFLDIILIPLLIHTTMKLHSNQKTLRQEKAIWESGFYSDWKESYNGVLEPTNFRGEENFVRAMLEIAGKKVPVTPLILQRVTEKKALST